MNQAEMDVVPVLVAVVDPDSDEMRQGGRQGQEDQREPGQCGCAGEGEQQPRFGGRW